MLMIIKWAIVSFISLLILLPKKLRISDIISKYLQVFYNDRYEHKKVDAIEIITILILPLLLSGLLVWWIGMNVLIVSELLTVISILSGLMFSLLSLIIGIKKTDNNDYNDAVLETFNIVAFEILNGIIIIFLLILCTLVSNTALQIMSFLTIYLVIIYGITLLIILKRFAKVFEYQKQ